MVSSRFAFSIDSLTVSIVLSGRDRACTLNVRDINPRHLIGNLVVENLLADVSYGHVRIEPDFVAQCADIVAIGHVLPAKLVIMVIKPKDIRNWLAFRAIHLDEPL